KPVVELHSVPEVTESPASSSVFDDLESLKRTSKIEVRRRTMLVNVAVDRLPSNSFFRAHSTWFLDDQTVLKDKDSGENYYITPPMRSHLKLRERLRPVTLAAVALWPADTVMVWPVPKLGQSKRGDFKAWKSA